MGAFGRLTGTACWCQTGFTCDGRYAGAHTRSIALATPSTHSGGIMRFAKVLLSRRLVFELHQLSSICCNVESNAYSPSLLSFSLELSS